jgi:hypothetical protein
LKHSRGGSGFCFIEIPLEADKHIPDFRYLAEFFDSIGHCLVFQLNQMRQFLFIQFKDTLLDIVIENEAQKFLLLFIAVVREYPRPVRVDPSFLYPSPASAESGPAPLRQRPAHS